MDNIKLLWGSNLITVLGFLGWILHDLVC